MSRRLMLLATTLCCVLATSTVFAQQQKTDLTPYLQAEVNEIALLTAQANYLQAQCDPLGASILASYVPDHQMMANLLSTQITAMGGNPACVVPSNTALLGCRQTIIGNDLNAHMTAINAYQDLAKNADPTIQRIAQLGVYGASRHFASLQIVQAATVNTPGNTRDGLMAALTLELTAIADLKAQSAQLTQLGDTATAAKLSALIPLHEAQVGIISPLLSQAGGNPAQVVALPVVALDTTTQILANERSFNTQLVNTYALAIAVLPNTNPLQQVAFQSQPIALAALNNLVGVRASTTA